MIKRKLWKKPLFLQLIVLGIVEILILAIYCYYFYCALIKEPAAYPELAKWITGYAEQFLQSTSMFILMEVGLTRAVAIYSPMRFKQIFSLGVISIFLGMAPIYGLAV
ncbi:MAG: hypothetical protein GY696_39750, partial [Gammaproteobacteria bacterium]|nr:hypothetical protein [Gammaproteobacteria bacterium]